MKNTIVWSALLTILATPGFAEEMPNTTFTAPTPASSHTGSTPATTMPQTQPSSAQPEPTIKAPTVTAMPPSSSSQEVPAANQAVNCDYKIPASMKVIDQSLVLDWSEKATLQAFSLDPANLDKQFSSLQPCFTEQGWSGFNTALRQSGNLDAIKAQKLHVSSHIEGKAQMTEAKINQWKVTMPLQVVYQNDKEKVSQDLTIDLTVNRKASGDLGITQIIATPRSNAANPEAAAPKY